MARGTTATLPYEGEDEREWCIEGRVIHGSRGTYLDPPDPDEVEFHDAVEDLDQGQLGPAQRLSFDDFVELYSLSEKDVLELEDNLINLVNDQDYGD